MSAQLLLLSKTCMQKGAHVCVCVYLYSIIPVRHRIKNMQTFLAVSSDTNINTFGVSQPRGWRQLLKADHFPPDVDQSICCRGFPAWQKMSFFGLHPFLARWCGTSHPTSLNPQATGSVDHVLMLLCWHSIKELLARPTPTHSLSLWSTHCSSSQT